MGLRRAFCLCTALLGFLAGAAVAQVPGSGDAAIALEHRRADDILPVLRRLFPDYRFTARERHLYASPMTLADAEFRRIVESLDRPPESLAVELRVVPSGRGDQNTYRSTRSDLPAWRFSVTNGDTATISSGHAVPTTRATRERDGSLTREPVVVRFGTRSTLNVFATDGEFDAEVVFDRLSAESARGGQLHARQVDTRVRGRLNEWYPVAEWGSVGGSANVSASRILSSATGDLELQMRVERR